MKATPIPTRSREIVRARSNGRCERCRVTGSEWHHRRSRSVRDEHVHCACNGVLLCKTCHDWVHSHPFEAKQDGFIVPRHEASPGDQSVQTPWGNRFHECDGSVTYIEQEQT